MPNLSNDDGNHRQAKRPLPAPANPNQPERANRNGGYHVPDMKPQPFETEQQQKAKEAMMDDEQIAKFQNNINIVDVYVNSRYLEMLSSTNNEDYVSEVKQQDRIFSNRSSIAVYRVTKILYNDKEDSYEKLVSIYSAMNSFAGMIAMILQSDGRSNSLYLCTSDIGNADDAGELLQGNINGQLPGSIISKLTPAQRDSLLDSFGVPAMKQSTSIRSLSMIPSRREDEQKADRVLTSQGLEKFIDTMQGKKYTLLILSQSVTQESLVSSRYGLENLYTTLSPYAKETVTYGENETEGVSSSLSNSMNDTVSTSISQTFGSSSSSSSSEGSGKSSSRTHDALFTGNPISHGSSSSWSSSNSNGRSNSNGTSKSNSESTGSTTSNGNSSTSGSSISTTLNRENKAAQNLMTVIDENIKRINLSQTFGMWRSCCYIISDDPMISMMGTSTLAALLSGDSATAPRAYFNQWGFLHSQERVKVLEYLQCLRHPIINLSLMSYNTKTNNKSVFLDEEVTPAMLVSGREISLLMGLPRRSVPGITVDHMAEFGRNISEEWAKNVDRPIQFGHVMHMGKLESANVCLDLDSFSSHTFICGAAGSGKSNTVYNLMQAFINYKVPFLVVEPVKGEYKHEFNGLNGINIFTASESAYRQLYINPMEFNSNLHIREHIDNMLQVISACWPLYGPMPGLLKQAFEQSYIDHGWDLDHSKRILNRGSRFPVFRDLLTALSNILSEQSYSSETEGDIKGALVNRISSLCNGFEGEIFGRSNGLNDSILFNSNTIIDLSNIGSNETRSLIMGVLIVRLREFRSVSGFAQNKTTKKVELKHITILEEAHNLLKRCSETGNEDFSSIQGTAVHGISNAIAEMRSSGEGFLIVDQSPTAVDLSAIKNTAVKIVMRLPEKQDCEEIGAALSLDDDQIKELSRLDIGVAAVSHVGWDNTIIAKMGNVWKSPYKLMTDPVFSEVVYKKIQSATIQLMYKDFSGNALERLNSDMIKMMAVLCTGPKKLLPEFSKAKQDENLETVRTFTNECISELNELTHEELMERLFAFMYEYLHFEGIMKVFPLTGMPDSPGKGYNAQIINNAVEWEKRVRKAVNLIVCFPVKCLPENPLTWQVIDEKAEYYLQIYTGLLRYHAKKYGIEHMFKLRYAYAMDCLTVMGKLADVEK